MKLKLLCLLAALLALLSADLAAATLVETPRMRRFGIADGLPSRMVLALAQDRQGYVWAATDDGLARYDGVDVRVWRHDPLDPRSLPANSVETLLVDPQDRIWVGANGGGLGMLDRRRDGFAHFAEVDRACNSQVWSLAYAQHALWVGTAEGGLCRRSEDGQVTAYRGDPADPAALPSDTIYSMLTDVRGQLWIGTGAGLVRRDGERFARIAPERLGGAVLKLSQEADGTLWIGSDAGLFRLSSDGVLAPAPWKAAASMRGATVLHDRNGGYWIGAADGLYRSGAGVGQNELRLMAGDRGSGFLTANSGVLDVMQDHEGGVWFGLITQGLAYLSPGWQRFSTVLEGAGSSLESLYMTGAAVWGDDFLVASAQGVYVLSGDGEFRRFAGLDQLGKGTARSVLMGADGQLWVGRAGHLTLYDPATRQRRDLPSGFGEEPFKLVDLLRQAPDGSVWMSVLSGGVQRRSPKGEILDSIGQDDGRGLPESRVEQMRFAADGRLWLANGEGLYRWSGKRFEAVPVTTAGPVHDFAFEGPKQLWLARPGMLERYDWDGQRLHLREQVGRAQGMPSVELSGLVLGKDGSVWATTARGMLVYRPQQRALRIFGLDAGLPDIEFSSRPPVVDDNGRALALTATGLVMFDPSRHFPPLSPSQLVVESVSVRRDDAERVQPLSPFAPLTLRAGDRDLRLTARLLSFANPQATGYRYRVAGYDQNWVEQGPTGERVLSRLPAGRYTVEVQARGVEGPWTPSQTLSLKVMPPWWRSMPSLLAGLTILLLLIWFGMHSWRQRLRRRQEWKLSQERQALAEQASLTKTRFLATLGHEVRTPMTGVLGMSELLLSTSLDARQRGHVESIRLAGSHLLRLLNDALDLARIEAGKLELEQQPFALREVLQELLDFMAPVAQSRGLAFDQKIDLPAGLTVLGDVTRLRQILMNLLANAIKFTEHGSVGLAARVTEPEDMLRFEISDTGPGIGAEQQARIFQRFEQGEGARTASRYGGSGLGLAICQELALAMKGGISIQSRLGEGTRFCVELPLPWHCTAPGASRASDEVNPASPVQALHILLVEDDPTVVEVIGGLLRAHGHRVTHAAHGLAALSETLDGMFDIALLDLDLPGLDGLALAVQMRALGHRFPLVAVTARADADAEEQARAAGFDGFVRKPVTGEMLATAIAAALDRNQRDQREHALDDSLRGQQLRHRGATD